MTETNAVARSMHDLGLAAWFGGATMGAIGLNGATAKAKDPRERTRLSSLGWARWAPANTLAIAVHGLGGLALVGANKTRVATQPGAAANTSAKTALTAAALGLTAYGGYLGRQVQKHADEGAEGATEPHPGASRKLEKAQRRLKQVQWAIPAVTGTLVVLGSVQGEQQRPRAVLGHQLKRLPGRS